MKIHAMCLVKNEADVIEECLRAASKWCDHIYVFDNGSTDGTWEIVQRMAAGGRIVPWKQDDKPFRDGLRQQIFTQFRDWAKPGDWWARLDADEFYVTDPKAFLLTVPKIYSVVWYASLSYYFSSDAAAEYELNPAAYADTVPVADRCRYYTAHWSEPRFARHEAMVSTPWSQSAKQGWPPGIEGTGCCPVRILAKHYCYRSPAQIEQRIATRLKSALSGEVFGHEALKDWAKVVDPAAVKAHQWKSDLAKATTAEEAERGWRSRVIPSSSLHYDKHDGTFVVDESLMPKIWSGNERTLGQDVSHVVQRVMSAVRRRLTTASG